ncbi:LysR family transcriptional regulator [Streptococcus mutans 5SM3]|uniref:LysR family transcriptional regulator n=1 Tax=Streptococcus mutans TaxID=1309 RepID=UPI0002B582AC|nr:LysR family transcriptional regulator [Streptococcus mutans]EMB77393.1 LysR family transcriptional regulator [Streptococcus mutans 5SM3]
MNIKDLVIYMSIYETQSLNQSAQVLGYAQSNLTARLKNMENELGAAFFIRQPRGLQPTDQGKQMYRFAKETLEHLAKLENSFNQKKRRILTSEILFNYALAVNQDIDLTSDKMDICKTSCIPAQATAKSYDIIYSFQRLPALKGYEQRTAELTAAFLSSNKPKGCAKLPLLINSDSDCPFRQITLKTVEKTDKVLEINSLENILSLLEQGRGSALLPEYLTQTKNLQKMRPKTVPITYFIYIRNVS